MSELLDVTLFTNKTQENSNPNVEIIMKNNFYKLTSEYISIIISLFYSSDAVNVQILLMSTRIVQLFQKYL